MSKYFNLSDFESSKYQTLFIIGARGVGKTVSTVSTMIKRCYKHHTKFIYLRRYQTEIDTLGFNLKLFSDLTGLTVEQKVVKDDSGRKVLMLTANNQAVGYLLALSVASRYKSNDYSNTELIVYDEFIDIRNRELKNEVNLYLNFAMTVFRDFNKYRAVFLANATNLFNCYFVDFNTFPRSRITNYKKLGIKIVMYEETAELKERDSSSLARLVRVAGDGDSSLDNEFKQQNGYLKDLSGKTKALAIVSLEGKTYGLWKDQDVNILSQKVDPSNTHKISVDELDEDWRYDPAILVNLSNMLKNNHLYFDSEFVRGVWLKALKEKHLIWSYFIERPRPVIITNKSAIGWLVSRPFLDSANITNIID